MIGFIRILRHDMRLHVRQPAVWASLVLFFIIVILLMPFALGPEPDLLRRLAPGFVWLSALLMALLSLDRLFAQDARDGTLDCMLLSPMPLPVIVLSKILAQCVTMLIALGVMIFPAGLLLNMSFAVMPVLLVTLLVGVPAMLLLGGIASAITISLRRNPALLTLLLMPFYIPILIFAVAACDAAAMGASTTAPLLFLGAILCVLPPETALL